MGLLRKKIKLKTRERNVFFKKEFLKLKIKVALNWFELSVLFTVTFWGTLKACFIFDLSYSALSLLITTLIAALIVLLFSYFRKYQLKITRFDKEHIYKKISADLFEKSKTTD